MFLTELEIKSIGFKALGKNLQISDKAVFYNPGNITIGDNSRIDDFCILSAGEHGIRIGCYVHIGCYSCLLGNEQIEMADYSGLSSKVSIYSSSDTYDGEFMTNPTVPKEYTKTSNSPVYLGKHVVVGAGSTILPGVILLAGCAVGAMSLVTKSFTPLSIVAGVPARRIRTRLPNIYDLEEQLNGNNKSKESNEGTV